MSAMEVGLILHERYELQKQMGRNAGRQTWLAKDLQHPQQEQVTIKLLTFGGDVQWQDLKLFEREAQILKQLDHPLIPQYRDYFSLDDRSLWFGLVQEYIPGASLKELLDRGDRFSEQRVQAIAKEILAILIYLHDLKPPILHRDIKPSNLIQGEDGQIHLVDFGAVQDKAVAEGSTLTVVGTYGYCPLEQFGGKACAASDLYALGATLIHLLTGVTPAELPTKNLRLQFRQWVTADEYFLDWLDQLVEPDLERRLQTAVQALDLLEGRQALSQPQGKIRIRQPLYSAIALKSFPNRLEITIPRRRFHQLWDYIHASYLFLFLLMTCIGLLTSPLVFASSIVLWIILGLIAWRSLTHLFRETQLLFTRNIFTIEKNIWGFKYFVSKGVTPKIQDISLAHASAADWGSTSYKPRMIVMTCQALLDPKNYDRRIFGEGLSQEELIWLAQEIRSWLFDYQS